MLTHLIDGQFQASTGHITFDAIEPATGDLLARFPLAGKTDIDAAVMAARQAFDSGPWPRMTSTERRDHLYALADLLEERAGTLAELETRDTGLPIAFTAGGHVPRSIEHLRYFADLANNDSGSRYDTQDAVTHKVSRLPLGVVAVLTPWNAPLSLATINLAAALAVGNTCILKASELAPMTAAALAQAVADSNLPPGVINVVYGDGQTTGATLASHAGVDGISFTGQTVSGECIAKIAGLRRSVMELGGGGAAAVWSGADLEHAVDSLILSAFANNGTACFSAQRVFVQQSIYRSFAAVMADRIAQLCVGDPMKPKVEVGPIIDLPHRNRFLNAIAAAEAGGARRLVGENPAARSDSSFYVTPTLLADAAPDMAVMRDEIAGPVVALAAFHDDAEALALINSTSASTAAYLWHKDIDTLNGLANRLGTGTVIYNGPMVRDIRVPFGSGEGAAGRVGGHYSLDAFSLLRTTTVVRGQATTFRLGNANRNILKNCGDERSARRTRKGQTLRQI